MKPTTIFIIGVFATALVLAASFWIGWFAVGFALLPAAVVLLGHAFVPIAKEAHSISLDPEHFRVDGVPQDFTITVSGALVALGTFRREQEFRLGQNNVALLALIVVGSFWVAAWVWPQRHGGMPELSPRPWILYYGGAGWFAVIGMAMRFLKERSILGRFVVALSSVHQRGRRAEYSFTDLRGEYFGDTVWQFRPSASEYELIFYRPENPNLSLPASALLFHEVVWARSSS